MATRRQQLSDGMVAAGRGLGNASAMLNHAVAEWLGLNPTDWECVSVLFDRGPLTAGQLAKVTGLTTGAVTGLIDRLEAAGYVRSTRDPADRRRVIVELVPERLDEVFPVFAPMLADMVASHAAFTDAQMEAVIEALPRRRGFCGRTPLRIRSGGRRARRPRGRSRADRYSSAARPACRRSPGRGTRQSPQPTRPSASSHRVSPSAMRVVSSSPSGRGAPVAQRDDRLDVARSPSSCVRRLRNSACTDAARGGVVVPVGGHRHVDRRAPARRRPRRSRCGVPSPSRAAMRLTMNPQPSPMLAVSQR